MSKTVRFKLGGEQETYAISTMHHMRRLGLLPEGTDLHSFSKQATLQALISLNATANKILQEHAEKQKQEAEANAIPAVDQTGGSDRDPTDTESADVSPTPEEEQERSDAEETGGDDVDSRDGGE